MGQVIQFIRKAELERARLIREARAIYDPQLVTARTHLKNSAAECLNVNTTRKRL